MTTGAGEATDADRRTPRVDGRALAVGLGVPLLAGAAVLGADVAWADRLAETITVNWGPTGRPAGTGDRPGFVALSVGSTVLVPAVLGAVAGNATVWTSVRRALLGVGTAVAVLLGALGVTGLAVQRDGVDGALPGPAMLGVTVVAVVLGVLCSRVPRELAPVVLATSRPHPDLPRHPGRGVAEHAVGARGRLRVEDDVVVVRWFGRVVMRVPVAEVESARAVTVSAFGEFGGWGLRMAPAGRRYGFLGAGPTAVELTKADGTRWVVTTPRAEEVAGVVNAAADRDGRRGG